MRNDDHRSNLTTRQVADGFQIGNFTSFHKFLPSHTYREYLFNLQRNRGVGTWVNCDFCNKFRYLMDVADPVDVPRFWTCDMNSNKDLASCEVREYKPTKTEEERLILTLYAPGSIVWAKHTNYPWWPAMVDDCPDTELYYWPNEEDEKDIPEYYHVTFLQNKNVSRAWITTSQIMPYYTNDTSNPRLTIKNYKDQELDLKKSIYEADLAKNLQIHDRLTFFSFISRFYERVNPPKDIQQYFIEEDDLDKN